MYVYIHIERCVCIYFYVYYTYNCRIITPTNQCNRYIIFPCPGHGVMTTPKRWIYKVQCLQQKSMKKPYRYLMNVQFLFFSPTDLTPSKMSARSNPARGGDGRWKIPGFQWYDWLPFIHLIPWFYVTVQHDPPVFSGSFGKCLDHWCSW